MSNSDLRARFQSLLEKSSAVLGIGTKVLLVIAGLLFLGLIFFLLDKYLAYRLVDSYVSRVASTFDLNEHLAQAITIIVFALFVVVMGLVFSLNRNKRRLGIVSVLALLVANSLLLWRGTSDQFFANDGKALKCYILDATGVRYRERAGIDPLTGRQCVEVTADILERLKEYQRGRRPEAIADVGYSFFDSTTGSPRAYFFKDAAGRIELFDLMGFHPRTGAALTPITKEIASEWQAQVSERNKQTPVRPRAAPKSINPKNAVFFDPITGASKLWFFRSQSGDYEFFDAEGFHPRTGDKLQEVSRQAVNEWEKFEREKAVRQQPASTPEQPKVTFPSQQSAPAGSAPTHDCDILAANPNDSQKSREVTGIALEALQASPFAAIQACEAAVRAFPTILRFQYQLARAMQRENPAYSLNAHQQLRQRGYLASFDNLAWMYIYGRGTARNRDIGLALLRECAALGEAECMHSLFSVLKNENPDEALVWLKRAASLGHTDALRDIRRVNFR